MYAEEEEEDLIKKMAVIALVFVGLAWVFL